MKLVEMKAGRMAFDGKKVSSDPRKGNLEISADPQDTHVRLVWRDEQAVADLEISVATESTLERVQAAKSGRVYILKQTGSEVRHFFWGQEAEESTEAERLTRFNLFLSSPDAGTALAIFQAENEDDFIVGEGEDTWEPPTAAPMGAWQPPEGGAAEEGDISQEEFISMVRRAIAMQSGEEGADVEFGDLEEQDNHNVTMIGLEELLTSEEMLKLLDDAEAVEELQTLVPEGHDLVETMKSAQLSAAMRQLTEAIYSEGLDVLFTSLGLDDSVGLETRHPLKAFCLALQRKYGSQPPQ